MAKGSNFTIFVVLNLVLGWSCILVKGEEKVPCYYVFGGAYFDNGNNNKLNTTINSNYLPYGIDDQARPNGRFSNALNIDDFIAIALGFSKIIPPFVDLASVFDVQKGINHASASGGIYPYTGDYTGEHFGMGQQLLNHETIVEKIKKGSKENATALGYMGKCLYTVSLGDNDYIDYFLNRTPGERHSPENLATQILGVFGGYMTRLVHFYGARKIAIFNIPPLGCSPLFVKNGSPCDEQVNDVIKIFNRKLKEKVDGLNQRLSPAKFIAINTYDITLSLFPEFKVTNAPCCPIIKETGLCVPQSTTCSNRSANIWFDGFRQCESAYSKIASRAMNNQSNFDVHPYDITHLINSS